MATGKSALALRGGIRYNESEAREPSSRQAFNNTRLTKDD